MKSSVAGIVDTGGGLRVVVTEKHNLFAHVGEGERLFVVPGLKVKEPVPNRDIPDLLRKVQQYINGRL